jgi:6-pyruvoyltetrahydropterin/6-carboxytetrahydropterin synthase
MIYLTRRVEFSASHVLRNPGFSDEENRKIYGECANPHGHGHNYVLEVTLGGEIDPKKGFFMNVVELKHILDEEIIGRLDHRNISVEVPYFREHVATSENIAVWIWRLLVERIDRRMLYRVRLFESSNNYVEYFGE